MKPITPGTMPSGGGIWRERADRLPRPQSVMGHTTPQFWRVREVEVPVAVGVPGPVIRYRWQRPLVIVHGQIMARSGLRSDIAALELSWTDQHAEQVVTSGLAMETLAALAWVGERSEVFSSRWAPLEIQVKHNDTFTFQFFNRSADPESVITPILLFHCVERDILSQLGED